MLCMYAADGLPSLPSLASSSFFPSINEKSDVDEPVPRLVHDLDPNYVCVSCKKLLRQPFQTICGHRLCRPCVLELHQTHGEEAFRCPGNEDSCEDIKISSLHPDFSASKYLRTLLIYCTNDCNEKFPWQQLKNHLQNDCINRLVTCVNSCGVDAMPAKELENHLKECRLQPKDCPFKVIGCKFQGTDDKMEEHKQHSATEHLELNVLSTAQAGLDISKQRNRTQEIEDQVDQMRSKFKEMKSNVDKISKDYQTLTVEFKQTEQSQIRTIAAQNETLMQLDARIARVQTDFGRELKALRERQDNLEKHLNNNRSQHSSGAATLPEDARRQLIQHDKALGIHDVRLAELDLRIQCTETTNYDGVLVWKIIDYSRRKRDAVSGTTLSLYSQPFYTSRYGYKMCARVYLNGDGVGRNTHVSLFFVVMQGDYDELLSWPFRQRVTLSLLDQKGTRRHLADAFRPDPTSSSFQRPTGPMNVASGCPLFIEHSRLEAHDSPYLVNNTLFFKVVVDTADLMNP